VPRAYSAEELRHPPEPEVLRWEAFQAMFAEGYEEGEHVSLVGPTGSGKSVTGVELIKIIGARRAHDRRPARVIVLADKPRDDTIMALHKDGWPIIKEWPPSYGQEHAIIWPRTADEKTQRNIFRPVLDAVYQEGGQTVYIDEAAYFSDPAPDGLGLRAKLGKFWRAARSNKAAVVAGTQRPCAVPRLMWSEPSWVLVFAVEDEDDLKRVAQLSGRPLAVWSIVPNLGGHEFMCIRRQRGGTRGIYVSRVDL
jgi:energy-coupling factor transporter ATP-binding protein EcfA2